MHINVIFSSNNQSFFVFNAQFIPVYSHVKKKEYEKDLPCRQTLFENDFSEYVTKIKSESERETIQENSKILLTKYAQVNLLLLCISTYSYVPRKNQFFVQNTPLEQSFQFSI